MRAGFEGSYAGDDAQLNDDAQLECKICWWVYDHAEGDETRQIPPGTPFSALPADWVCPNCDGDKAQFMLLDAGTPAPATPPRFETLPKATETAFREIYNAKLRDTPLVNKSLSVEAVGFRVWDGNLVGVLVAPWFMNLILFSPDPDAWADVKIGTKREIVFPSGAYEFAHANRERIGPYLACSLFSPMGEFGSHLQAVETARAVMAMLFDEKAAEADETDRSAEIRARREAELAEADESAAEAVAETPRAEPPAALSRRAVIAPSSDAASA